MNEIFKLDNPTFMHYIPQTSHSWWLGFRCRRHSLWVGCHRWWSSSGGWSSRWNVDTRRRSRWSSSLSVKYSSLEYFISQRLITSSLRSIRRSICTPLSFSSLGLCVHEWAVLMTAEKPRAFLIWSKCWRQTRSKAKPAHVSWIEVDYCEVQKCLSSFTFCWMNLK